MGYTHYWHRPLDIPGDLFRAIATDFARLVLPLSDAGIPLAGGLGEGLPVIDEDVIRFNGVHQCGHPRCEDLIIPYPSEDAEGVGPASTAIIDGYAFGAIIRHRCCSGFCSYETFELARSKELRFAQDPDELGLYGEFTKTAFRPYDIAVTAALVVAKNYLRDSLVIHSDGTDTQWIDAKRICQSVLGYGDWFGIIEEPIEEDWPAPGGLTEKRTVRLRTLYAIQPPT